MIITLMPLLFLFFPFHSVSEELNGENLLFQPPDGYHMGFSDSNNDTVVK